MAQQGILVNPTGKAITRGNRVGPGGAKEFTVQVPFVSAAQTVVAYNFNVQAGGANVKGMQDIQSVFMDNADNANVLFLFFPETNQRLACPAFSQAIFPVFFGGMNLNFIASISAANADVTLQFTNTQEQPAIWVANTIGGTIPVSGTVLIQPVPSAPVNQSRAQAVPNASEQLVAANGARKRLIIQNPSTPAGQGVGAAEYAWFSMGGACVPNALGVFELPPGSSYDSAAGPCPTSAIFMSAATAGHRLTCEEF